MFGNAQTSAKELRNRLEDKRDKEHTGFQPNKEAINQILNFKMIIEKSREYSECVFTCFIHYENTFHTVDHSILWSNKSEMSFPTTNRPVKPTLF